MNNRDKFLIEAMGHKYISSSDANGICIIFKGESLNTYLHPWLFFGFLFEWAIKGNYILNFSALQSVDLLGNGSV